MKERFENNLDLGFDTLTANYTKDLNIAHFMQYFINNDKNKMMHKLPQHSVSPN